ncbi:T9SS type A sorting domain-containing protein [uncultured Flavobacterium sp.]|uniref:poly(ethylene terephthalate) hydrolase family protein n=1 Tax=uncultured Flavobacterium sp. TaxID=165435 RepID=UPI0030CA222E
MIKIKLKDFIILVGLLIFCTNIRAQSFDIGHASITFYDSSRNRYIETEVYYPAYNSGENTPIASGNFPVIVFGHGFLMSWASYENFWTELVPNGYVICFPTTEMTLTPNHENFGLDLKFAAAQMQNENNDSSSLFFNSLAPKTGLMGHSMGGGASFLAAENNTIIHTLVTFAAAETNPSAISSSSNITVPTLIFSGDDDCVTPPDENQILMYNYLASTCKTHISIIGGGHCYFADDNFNCTLGESFCNSTLNITREEQQLITFNFLKLWLNYFLYDDLNAFNDFDDALQISTQINFTQFCNTLTNQDISGQDTFEIYPNPVINKLNLLIPIEHTDGILTMYNLVGQQVYQSLITNTTNQIDVSNYPNGPYFIVYNKNSIMQYYKIIKIDR